MDLVWLVYLIDVLCDNKGLQILGTTFLLFGSFGFAIMVAYEFDGESLNAPLIRLKALLGRCLVGVSLVLFVLSFIPSKSTAYKMVAAYAGQELVQMEGTKEVGTKAYKALNKVLDDYLKVEDE